MKKRSLHDVKMRHAQHYLRVVSEASDLFDEEETQTKGLMYFDTERPQIDFALEWICQQPPSVNTDVWYIQFVAAIYSIGLVRYQVGSELIPLVEQQVLAAQRLQLKDVEADALDSIGILYAYLGYYETAIEHFKKALLIARQTQNRDLEVDIATRLELAQQELKEQRQFSRVSQSQDNKNTNERSAVADLKTQLLLVRSRNDLLGEVTILKQLAAAYELENNHVKAAEYQEEALAISQKAKLRFSEIDSRIKLALNYFSKPNTLSDYELQEIAMLMEQTEILASEDKFAWGIDLSVLGLFIEMAPIMRQLEGIADFLKKQKDPRAKELYQILDSINIQTSNITLAAQRDPESKLQLLPGLLQTINQEVQKARRLVQG